MAENKNTERNQDKREDMEARKEEAQELRESLKRKTPQKVYDQGETYQVGGTVINPNLNKDEYAVEQDVEEDEDGTKATDPEVHNYDEGDPDNPFYDTATDAGNLEGEAKAEEEEENDEPTTRESNKEEVSKETKGK